MDVEGRRLQCGCGEEVLAESILTTAYEMRAVGPDYLYVKFRCPRCRRLGEQRIEQPSVRRLPPTDPARVAGTEPDSPISVVEIDEFHRALSSPGALAALAAQVEHRRSPGTGDDD